MVMASGSVLVGQVKSVASKTLRWSSESRTEMRTRQTVNDRWTLVTNAGASIDLLHGAQESFSFAVSSIAGEWTDPTREGKLVYAVTYQGNVPGTVTISRTKGELHAVVDFTRSNPDGMYVDFLVSSVGDR